MHRREILAALGTLALGPLLPALAADAPPLPGALRRFSFT
jgi:hypothetical protein